MQRIDIDEVDFAVIETELTQMQILPGDIAIVIGEHPVHGTVMLIQAGGLYAALSQDVSSFRPREDPLAGC